MQNVSKLVEFLVVAQHGQFFRENICAYLQSHSQDRTCTKMLTTKFPVTVALTCSQHYSVCLSYAFVPQLPFFRHQNYVFIGSSGVRG